MKRKVIALLMAAVMALSLAACGEPNDGPVQDEGSAGTEGTAGAGTAGTSEDGKKVFRYGIESAPAGIFLEQYHQDQYNGYVTYAVFEGLTQANPDGEQEPLLAKSWDISEDGKTYTFHLEEGVTWHDGEPFTAEDVSFTYHFMSDPDYGGFYGQYVQEIAGYDEYHDGTADSISGINVIDENTIAITTKDVYSSMLARIGNIKIIAKHIWEGVDVKTADSQTDMIRNPIGTGAFMLNEELGAGEFVPDQYVTLAANENYWRGTPKVDEISFIVINPDTVEAQLANGEIDYYELLNINADDLAMYEAEGLTVNVVPGNSYQCMQINQKNPLFAPVEVRQALACAIDRQSMVDGLLDGYGNVANTIYAESYWAHPGNDALTVFEYNPERAIELFESAGWSYDEEANVMTTPDGEPASFTLYSPTGNTVREQSAAVIQDNLKKIGIEINVETLEFATLLDILNDFMTDPEGKWDTWDFALTGYGLGADPDTSLLIATEGPVNYGNYSNEEVDNLINTALHSIAKEDQEAAWKEMAVVVSETLPALYLYNVDLGDVRTDRVVACERNTYWNSYNTYLWEVK